MANTVYLEDYLDEDPVIPNQKFFILSYLLPDENNEIDVPLFKVRGSYKTVEECEAKIERLKMKEGYFNLYICEVGKWSGLYTNAQLEETDNVDIVHRDQRLNAMMKSHKENRDNADKQFEERKKVLSARNKFEGTKEGQEYLSSIKESPIAVKSRIDFADNELINLKKKINDITQIKIDSEKAMTTYTQEELDILKTDYKNPTLVNEVGELVKETARIESLPVKPIEQGTTSDSNVASLIYPVDDNTSTTVPVLKGKQLYEEMSKLSVKDFNNQFNDMFTASGVSINENPDFNFTGSKLENYTPNGVGLQDTLINIDNVKTIDNDKFNELFEKSGNSMLHGFDNIDESNLYELSSELSESSNSD